MLAELGLGESECGKTTVGAFGTDSLDSRRKVKESFYKNRDELPTLMLISKLKSY